MKAIYGYNVLTNRSYDGILRATEKAIREAWEPHGELLCVGREDHYLYIQMIVKPVREYHLPYVPKKLKVDLRALKV